MTGEWPVDTSTLEKGSEIPAALCATILRHMEIDESGEVTKEPLVPGTSKYQLALLRLRDVIEGILAERGLAVVIRTRENGLRILTDSEAAEYTDRRGDNHLEGLMRAYVRQTSVDAANLTDAERSIHREAVQKRGRILQSALNAARVRRFENPSVPTTPKMIGPSPSEDDE